MGANTEWTKRLLACEMEIDQASAAAAFLGRIGGKAKSKRKTESSRRNAKKGGRPKKSKK